MLAQSKVLASSHEVVSIAASPLRMTPYLSWVETARIPVWCASKPVDGWDRGAQFDVYLDAYGQALCSDGHEGELRLGGLGWKNQREEAMTRLILVESAGVEVVSSDRPHRNNRGDRIWPTSFPVRGSLRVTAHACSDDIRTRAMGEIVRASSSFDQHSGEAVTAVDSSSTCPACGADVEGSEVACTCPGCGLVLNGTGPPAGSWMPWPS
jgi:hypothetical protein